MDLLLTYVYMTKKYTELFQEMKELYIADPTYAVRSKKFIGLLEKRILNDIWESLSDKGKSILRKEREVEIFQDSKNKNVDIAIIDPSNGPLITIGVRSQMNSIAKNTLTYYQDIRGELAGLINRHPLSVHGYLYLHPKEIIKPDATDREKNEKINHHKYAKLFSTISGRGDANSITLNNPHLIRNCFDHFSYFVVDFKSNPIDYQDSWDDIDIDLSIDNFVDNIIKTSKDRLHFTGYFK